jgi:molybdenum cofactor cytidylyltransferase
LGTPKQLVEIGGETLLARAVRVVREADLEPCFMVISTTYDVTALAACTILLNEQASEGMASSIRLGISAAQAAGVEGAVIMACDQPAVTASHLRLLVADGDEVAASAYAGRRGVPAYFPKKVFGELMALRGDVGARQLLRDARCVELPGGELDVDAAEDLAQARRLFA